ncbi:MAG: hypothetical protein E7223_03160 [Clostridiales bacterium]|nr:hypothetical protein [Clostridiales bacterium]MBQ3107322.1 hypothetical protein [Bacillota bacterium]
MRQTAWGNEYRSTKICIDSYQNGVPEGRIYSPYLAHGIRFRSLTQFLLQMEALLDEMNFPQANTLTRTFAMPPREERNKSSPEPQRGKESTFHVKVLFRQHTSWQGSVQWLETGQEQSFRSVLELILLMDSALRREDDPEECTA